MNANKTGDPAVVVTSLRLAGLSNCGVSIPGRIKGVVSYSELPERVCSPRKILLNGCRGIFRRS